MMTLGKGVGGGLAVGVMCARPEVAELYDAVKQGGVKHASTLGGNCLAMAVSHAVFQVLERDGLVQRAAELGDYVKTRLRELANRVTCVMQVRGKGLFVGIELDRPAKEVVDTCRQRGVMLNGTHETVVRMAPPLVVSRDQLDEGIGVLGQVLSE